MNTLFGCTSPRTGSDNIARCCNPWFDTLVMKGKVLLKQAEHLPLCMKAKDIFYRKALRVLVVHPVVIMAIRSSVIGFEMDPLGRHIFEDVDLSEAQSR